FCLANSSFIFASEGGSMLSPWFEAATTLTTTFTLASSAQTGAEARSESAVSPNQCRFTAGLQSAHSAALHQQESRWAKRKARRQWPALPTTAARAGPLRVGAPS